MPARILVVDDEPQFERLISRRLRKQIKDQQYDFSFAGDGVEALEILAKAPPFDLVLADINMPRMDGLTLLTQIRTNYPLLKTVIVSAYGDMENIRTAMNRGAFDFVLKPIDFEDLEITIEKTLKEVELVRKIEQTKELEEKNASLQKLDILKTRFFTNISHEFRTPLTVVSGMAGQIDGNDRAKTLIQRNVDRLLNLVNQILDLQKLDAGQLQLKLIQGEVTQYLHYIRESFQDLAAAKNIQLHLLADDEILMDFDREKLLRIVYNLLSNAIKFTPEEGNVYIQLNQLHLENKPHLCLKVKDTGVGISPEQLPFVFDRFYQAQGTSDNHRIQQGQGTGIGLSITKELVELMGGKIEVKSEVEKGTVFNVFLPIKNEAPIRQDGSLDELLPVDLNAFSTEELIEEQNESTALPSLLIIEDNQDVAAYLISCLQDEYQLEVASDGQQGIDKALEMIPDIIISDVMMPHKDGFEVCDILKNDERSSHIPIVLLTAKADVESRIAGLKKGADAYLKKPFHQEELQVILQNLLDLRKKLHLRYTKFSIPATDNDPALVIEDAFITKVREAIEEHIDDTEFGIPQLCRAVRMSRSQLHNKLKALTGLSTSIYSRKIRLTKAKHLLETTDLNVSEVAYDVGFKDPRYFSRLFNDEFGMPPSKTGK